MMYSSFHAAKKDRVNKFGSCPLARWIDPEDYGKGTVPVQRPRAILDMDYEWIKETYPYKEPPKRL